MLFLTPLFRTPFGARRFTTNLVLAFPLTNHRLFNTIDWDKVESGMYAVVDPMVPNHILYLTEYDYIIQVRVSQTNNRTLKVLATPEDTRDSQSPSQNSPQSASHPFLDAILTGNQSRAANSRSAKNSVSYLFHSPFLGWRSRKDGEYESMIAVTDRNIRTWITRWHDLVSWFSRGSSMSTVAMAERNTFSARARTIFLHNGVQFLILYLKGCLFIINSYLSGKKCTGKDIPGKVRIRIVNGLPAIIPLYARNGIRAGNKHFIHIWTSVTNAYKGLEGVYGEVDLSTITQAHPPLEGSPVFLYLKTFAKVAIWEMLKSLGGRTRPDLLIKRLFCSSKAGPNAPNVVLGAPRDAYIWQNLDKHPHTGVTRNLISEWLLETGNERVRKLFRVCGKRFALTGDILSHVLSKSVTPPGGVSTYNRVAMLIGGMDRPLGSTLNHPEKEGILGRLHALYEPAGKIRIVALVDYWTHCCLKPLHDWMFALLRVIPSDATFDQEGRLREFSRRGYTDIWSIDLSAATDTIPLELYRAMFDPILGTKLTSLWLEILVGRNFLVPSELDTPEGRPTVRYGCGQPMGALSSWSSMAMVHHLLVQCAAFSTSRGFVSDMHAVDFLSTAKAWEIPTWYLDYLILGDDLVIANENVAREYIRIATSLGIKVGMAKSFISERGFLNFANQSYLGDANVSPLSLKEFIGISSLAQRAEFALRAVRRGWVDIGDRKWLAPLLKLFVNERIWTQIQKDLAQGVTHPIVSWILSVLLVPGSTRFADSVLPRVSIKTYLATMLQKALIWTKPLKDIETLINPDKVWGSIREILSRISKTIYQDFLVSRKRLVMVDKWIDMTMSVDGQDLLKEIFQDQVQERLDEWAGEFRHPVKAIDVCTGPLLKDWTLAHFEIGTGLSLEENVTMLSRASEALPRIPDYDSLDFTVMEETPSTMNASERELKGFARLVAMVGGCEHLHSFATPGIDRSKLGRRPRLDKPTP